MPTTATRMTQRERNRNRTRVDILDAAAALMSAGEFASASLSTLGADAGVSRGTLYAHFPGGREDIAREVYSRTAAEVLARGEEMRARATGFPERIQALARALCEICASESGKFYGNLSPDLTSTISEVSGTTSRSFEEFIRADLEAARERGELPSDVDAEALTTVFSGALRASGARVAREPERVAAQVAALGLLAAGVVHVKPDVTVVHEKPDTTPIPEPPVAPKKKKKKAAKTKKKRR